ncbi:lipid II:glycine glycyltransferase FemX [Enemella sp. A6]|uniref:lipid II:glycine glycyltransferase FemX n=1 Tax=Enemella sp. A6 TaxID=3440152 RepID=UPI003EBD59B3
MVLTLRPIGTPEHMAFTRARRDVSFQQTPAWAKVKPEWRSELVGWFDAGRLVGTALVLHRPVPALKRYTLAYLPQGPLIDWSGDVSRWLAPLTTYLRAQGAFAVRLDPPVRTHLWSAEEVKRGIADPMISTLPELPATRSDPVGIWVTHQLEAAGWLPQHSEHGFGSGQPQFTYEVPLADRSPEDVLGGMNQLWRRNIKKAAAAGVTVTVSDDLAAFHALYVHTAERDGFTPRPLHYFENMFAAMRSEQPDRIQLYLARHDGDPVAAGICVRVGGNAWYVYGASATAKREVRGSNACQWAMIRDALAADCDRYSLRGITSTLDPDDPHMGLTQFKVGTGGAAVRSVGEWDLPLRPTMYRAFQFYLRRREAKNRR